MEKSRPTATSTEGITIRRPFVKVLFDYLSLFVQRQTEMAWTGLGKITFFPCICNSIASTYKFSQQRKKKKKKKNFCHNKRGKNSFKFGALRNLRQTCFSKAWSCLLLFGPQRGVLVSLPSSVPVSIFSSFSSGVFVVSTLLLSQLLQLWPA